MLRGLSKIKDRRESAHACSQHELMDDKSLLTLKFAMRIRQTLYFQGKLDMCAIYDIKTSEVV